MLGFLGWGSLISCVLHNRKIYHKKVWALKFSDYYNFRQTLAFGRMASTATIGNTDGDANSALAELDQGLRSGRLGEQSEAIVKFPRLFTKYPFPILINSALLKLADIFRQSSNFIRLCVLNVVQQSERHLVSFSNYNRRGSEYHVLWY